MHTGTGYDALYFVTDHLGSTRATVDSEGNIQEQNDYYAFGSRMDNGLPMSTANRYRFSGKEEQVVANINLLDFGARMYDDEICRWTTVDPLAEKYYSMTPYNYCANNPVMFVDPEGRDAQVTVTDSTITITSVIYIYGELANNDLAEQKFCPHGMTHTM